MMSRSARVLWEELLRAGVQPHRMSMSHLAELSRRRAGGISLAIRREIAAVAAGIVEANAEASRVGEPTAPATGAVRQITPEQRALIDLAKRGCLR